MARPVVSAAAEELYEALEPAFTDGDEARDWPALRLCDVLTSGDVARLHTYVTDHDDGTPGWVTLLDPDNAPAEALPWLAQFVGAVLRPDMTEAQQRAAIKVPEAFGRGTIPAIIAVTKRRLTGSQSVVVTERYTGNAWRLRIETIAEETPDPARTEAEIRAEQKPIGIVLFFNTTVPWTWGELKAEEANWTAVESGFADWGTVRTHVP